MSPSFTSTPLGVKTCIDLPVFLKSGAALAPVPTSWNAFRALAEDVRSGRVCSIAASGGLRASLQAAIDDHLLQFNPGAECRFCQSGKSATLGGAFLTVLEQQVELAIDNVQIAIDWYP
ncbi:hypothetical protein BV25DRAFT_1911558 [Artomyces pyxidatus]|uniref:Uncharacterized protein n=1 Tax=Artomyces pyxidatus TaxID=48021 RepID=A0ACB8TGW8_9AGAM|nr:hypothetical protein BV25DRAFT_1911558 [Artomyces pyxidatus]